MVALDSPSILCTSTKPSSGLRILGEGASGVRGSASLAPSWVPLGSTVDAVMRQCSERFFSFFLMSTWAWTSFPEADSQIFLFSSSPLLPAVTCSVSASPEEYRNLGPF